MDTVKTTIIDHPMDENKYLVFGDISGPNSTVFFRGTGHIDNYQTSIQLPNYATSLATNFSIILTPIETDSDQMVMNRLTCTNIDENGNFTVSGTNSGDFFWHVFGIRRTFDPEPNKESVVVNGSQPYVWLT